MKKIILPLLMLPAIGLASCTPMDAEVFFGKTIKYMETFNGYEDKYDDGTTVKTTIIESFEYIDWDNFPGQMTFTNEEKANPNNFMNAFESKVRTVNRNHYSKYEFIFSDRQTNEVTVKYDGNVDGVYKVQNPDAEMTCQFGKPGGYAIGDILVYSLYNNRITECSISYNSDVYKTQKFIVNLKEQHGSIKYTGYGVNFYPRFQQ